MPRSESLLSSGNRNDLPALDRLWRRILPERGSILFLARSVVVLPQHVRAFVSHLKREFVYVAMLCEPVRRVAVSHHILRPFLQTGVFSNDAEVRSQIR